MILPSHSRANGRGTTFKVLGLILAILLLTDAQTQTISQILAGRSTVLTQLTAVKNAATAATCSVNMSLADGEQFIWKDSQDERLNVSSKIKSFRPEDKQYREVSIVLNDLENYTYIMCIDPRTLNVVQAFQIQHDLKYKPMYADHQTTCAIHPAYWTVINCENMFLPPVVVKECQWSYSPRDGLEVDIWHKSSSVQVLGRGVFDEQPGWYRCQCGPHNADQYLIGSLSFEVQNSTWTTRERDTASYQFCQHIPKVENIPTDPRGQVISQAHNSTDTLVCGECPDHRPLHAVYLCVVFTLLAVIAIGFVVFMKKLSNIQRSRLSESSEMSPITSSSPTNDTN